MSHHCRILAASAFLMASLLNSSLCPAATLAHWEADDTPGPGGMASANATSFLPDIVASPVTISTGGAAQIQNAVAPTSGASLSGDPVFRTNGWNAATPTKFYAFDIDVTGENTMTVDALRFFAVHSGVNRTVNYRVDVSTDGMTFVPGVPGTITENASPFDWQEFNVDLTALNIAEVTDPVLFRLFMWNNSAGESATTSIDDIRVIGSLTSVPEPRSIAIWSLAALVLTGLSYYRCRRK